MTQLSPAAQAVFVSVCSSTDRITSLNSLIAAALRSVVEQCKYADDFGDAFLIADEVEAIAAELEAADG